MAQSLEVTGKFAKVVELVDAVVLGAIRKDIPSI
jgi:hypothetical protein